MSTAVPLSESSPSREAAVPLSVNASMSNVVRDESVSVSLSTCTVKGDDENEYTSGVGVSAMPGRANMFRRTFVLLV